MIEPSLHEMKSYEKIKDNQGGEIKVMKKSLSILLILALVISIFSAISFAATSQSGLELKGYGLIKGDIKGDLMESTKWKRQDVVVILSRLLGKESEAKAYQNTHKFTDVKNSFYNSYISWAKDQNLFTGKSATLFGFNDDITYQEFIAVIIRALGYTGTSEVAYSAVGVKATELGLIANSIDIKLPANRGVYFDILLKAINVKNTDGIVFGTALKLTGFIEKPITVTSVTALTTRTDITADAQLLSFSINGEANPTTVKALNAAGYVVEFSITNTSFLVDKNTGELNEVNLRTSYTLVTASSPAKTFDYNVSILKDNVVVAKSSYATVRIIDYSLTAGKILAANIVINTDVPLKDSTLAVNDSNVSYSSVQVELLNGSTVNYTTQSEFQTELKFATTDSTKLFVGGNGVLTPLGSGTATVTISKDDAKLSIPYTIVTDARKATKVTTNISQIKIVNSLTKDIEIQVMDQYNSPFKGLDILSTTTPISIKSSVTNEIAAVLQKDSVTNSGKSNKDGKITLTLTANATNVGTGAFEIKDGTRILGSIPIIIGKSAETTTRRVLEAVNSTKDIVLNLKVGSPNRTIDLTYNKYDTNGYYQGFERTTLSIAAAVGIQYIVESSDISVATVAYDASTGTITVNSMKKGTANILIKEGTIIRDSLPINVTDTSPTIASVTFEPIQTITSAGLLPISSIVKTSNIKLSNSDQSIISITDGGVIYIEQKNTGYSANDDVTLGKFTMNYYVTDTNKAQQTLAFTAVASIGRYLSTLDPLTATVSPFVVGDSGQLVLNIQKEGEASGSFPKPLEIKIK